MAFVVYSFDVGGLERCIAHLVNHLDERWYQFLIVCLSHNGGGAHWIERDGVPIVELRKPPGNSLKVVRELRDVLREHDVDLVHSHNWGSLLETTLACRALNGIRHVHAEHGLELDAFRVRGWKRALRRRAMGWCLRRADAIVACAHAVQRWIVAECGVDEAKLTEIPNGVEPPPVDSSTPAALRRALGLPASSYVLGSVGRLVDLKGFADAIRATANLVASGRDVYLVLVGDGPERARLQSAAADLDVAGRVHFVGEQANVGSWLRLFDVYVNSSHSEAMNMAILEALSCGLPVVATDVGDSARLVGGSVPAGLLVPSRQPAALARALGELLGDPGRRQELGDHARARYESDFTVDRMVERYSSLYAGILGCAGRTGSE